MEEARQRSSGCLGNIELAMTQTDTVGLSCLHPCACRCSLGCADAPLCPSVRAYAAAELLHDAEERVQAATARFTELEQQGQLIGTQQLQLLTATQLPAV